ncbi:MAG: hypothetical protein BAA01_01105 [Bacillus thermozeamaize]|uniref:Rhodanese domain-containing protein n=1 Tax=Bacillus thermozeamaize TaxID=230954 RepID=A0A1Y3PM67_9BACI|nr:MAG: hypothetical protein BAA01_01105 [Bacillus thermozeamaize]
MRVVEMLPEVLQKKLEQGEPIQIIDVREPEEVAMGMIRGARHIPLGEPALSHERDRSRRGGCVGLQNWLPQQNRLSVPYGSRLYQRQKFAWRDAGLVR